MRKFEVTLKCKKCGVVRIVDVEVERWVDLYPAIQAQDLDHLEECKETGATISVKELEKVRAK